MSKDNPRTYYMIATDHADLDDHCTMSVPPGLTGRLLPGDGILVGSWNEASKVGAVSGLAVIRSIDSKTNRATISYRDSSLTLKPHPTGRRWWKTPHFKFAETVREKYMLDDIFCEKFPDYSSLDITPRQDRRPAQPKSYLPIAGCVYVLQSEYGYKIGKTVSLKDRLRLFGVKLPFKIELIISGYVDSYSEAEASLHRKYAQQRLEGEWFDLSGSDLKEIEAFLSTASPTAPSARSGATRATSSLRQTMT